MLYLYEHYYMSEEEIKNLKLKGDETKESFYSKYDYLHKWFLNENEDLTFEQIQVVKKVFDFLKNKLGG